MKVECDTVKQCLSAIYFNSQVNWYQTINVKGKRYIWTPPNIQDPLAQVGT